MIRQALSNQLTHQPSLELKGMLELMCAPPRVE
jgi:hypothetical protein